MCPIEALSPPTRQSESKYTFKDEDVKAAVQMLKDNGHPGQGGYEKEGAARSAAARLIEQCEAIEGAPDEIGSRAWEDPKTKKWAFALKVGKRQPNKPKS